MAVTSALAAAMSRFETPIVVKGSDPKAVIKEAFRQNPKLFYYFSAYTCTASTKNGGTLTYDMTYQNTKVPPADLYVAASAEEVESILCQYIGNYRYGVVIFAEEDVDIEAAYREFMAVNAYAYPNFTQCRRTKYSSALGSMPCYEFCFDYRIGRVMLGIMKRELQAEIKRVAELLFLPGMSAPTKALLAHNYLADTVTYTQNEEASPLERSYLQSAYGALINHKCVCQGYAEAFKLLMDHAGIDSEIICGQTDGSDTYHAWNILLLYGEKDNYHIDVTWDSSEDGVSHRYFGLRDSDFEGKRTWNRSYTPVCRGGHHLLKTAALGIFSFRSELLRRGARPNWLKTES